jgi:hypothetical protein
MRKLGQKVYVGINNAHFLIILISFRVFLQTPIVAQLVGIFPFFTETELIFDHP